MSGSAPGGIPLGGIPLGGIPLGGIPLGRSLLGGTPPRGAWLAGFTPEAYNLGLPLKVRARMTAVIELVVAASENDVIGRASELPWHLPADMRRFKALTLDKPVLMGRKTYESIGKALPMRMNIVLSRSAHFAPGDCHVVRDVDQACAMAGDLLMVIGGADVYRQCLSMASRIHLTLVHTRIEDGDTFFPDWRLAPWSETARQRFERDDKHAHAYSFVTLERRET